MIELFGLIKLLKFVYEKFLFVLLTAAMLYVLYMFILIIEKLLSSDKYKKITQDISNYSVETHSIGIILILLISVLMYHKYKYKIKGIFNILKSDNKIEIVSPLIFTEKEAKDHLIKFSNDAVEIRVLAGDANFIDGSDSQIDSLISCGSDCYILMSRNHKASKDCLRELISNNVNIRTYPNDDNKSLRGRIKQAANISSVCLFDKRGDGFHFMEFDNSVITKTLTERYDSWFKSGRHPLVKYILFDLGHVLLNGDYHLFIEKVEAIVSCKIPILANNYLCSNKDLNLGKTDINQYISSEIGRSLDEDEKNKIIELWNNTWSINLEVEKLALELRNNGYTICVASNCDVNNADIYDLKHYFELFHEKFFSFELDSLKPSKEFYTPIFKRLNAKPYECLLIDDHIENINMSNELTMESIHVHRSTPEDMRAQFIRAKLMDKCLI